ncbi:MAG: hypothetical protein L0Y58_02675 [Verrucomicrobia subdivision 3 bacterium]|nr:hypothetical protein [Limisphaerales bacterium]
MISTSAGVVSLPVFLPGEPERIGAAIEHLRARQVLFYLAIMVIGAGAFRAAMGCWRAPRQALFTALKLPLAILLTSLGNALLNGMLAPLSGLLLLTTLLLTGWTR